MANEATMSKPTTLWRRVTPRRHASLPGHAAILFLCVFAAAILPAGATAQEGEELAYVHRLLLDRVLAVEPPGGAGHQADLGEVLRDGDQAYTNESSRAAIRFTDDGSLIRMNPNTRLSVQAEGDRDALTRTLDLEFGEIWSRITRREDREFRVRTPAGVAAIRGTDIFIRVDPTTGETTVITLDGVLDFFNDAGTVEIPAGSKTVVAASGEQPVVEPVEPDDLAAYAELIEDPDETSGEVGTILLRSAGPDGRTVEIVVPLSVLRAYLDPGGGP